MNGFLDFVFSFSGFALAAVTIALGVAFGLVARPRVVRMCAVLLGIYMLLSVYGIAHAGGLLLSRGFHRFEPPIDRSGRTAIIVLGTGEWALRGWDGQGFTMFTPAGVARVLEARRVFGMFDDAWVITSGGAQEPEPHAPTSGEAMQIALVQMGVPRERILIEEKSASTHEEAVEIVPMLKSLKPARAILVTSDFHMLRSVGTFRSEGVEVIPAIARDPYMGFSWQTWAMPTNQGLRLSGAVLHEFLGIPYYAARGWWR